MKQCNKKCSSLTRSEAAKCQRINSVICNHCNSNAGDRERCSVCGKDFKLHQYRAMCNICSSPCHLACTQLPRNDRDKSKTGTNNGPAVVIVLYPVNHSSHSDDDGGNTSDARRGDQQQANIENGTFSVANRTMAMTVGCFTCNVCKRSILKDYP